MTTVPDDVEVQALDTAEAADAGTASRAFGGGGTPDWLTGYLTEYWNAHPEDTKVPAGTVVLHALQGPPGDGTSYLDVPLPSDTIAGSGPTRTVRDHLTQLRRRWDPALSPVITVVRVVLGLAIDPELGGPLVRAGVVESVVRLWRPRAREGTEPKLLPWDMLSDRGREEAEAQPLLAAALGAPSEWNGEQRIHLPGRPSGLAFAPSGDRVAALCGDDVYAVARNGAVEHLAEAGPGAQAVGWGRSGVVVLALAGGDLTLRETGTDAALVTRAGVVDAAVSGDGSTVWAAESGGVVVLRVGDPDPTVVTVPATRVLAVSPDGRLAIVGNSEQELVLSLDGPPTSSAGAVATPSPGVVAESRSEPASGVEVRAVGRLGALIGRARPGQNGGVLIEPVPGMAAARIATGTHHVTALAPAADGRLAVAAGNELGVWSVATAPPVEVRPQYAPDRAAAPQDLLEVDLDAQALGALIASADLTPPLAVGLFGAWGSGKSFLLARIASFIAAYGKAGRAQGYLEHVPVVRFNAWHYAETNLWASLVNEVLDAVRKECSPAWEADEEVRRAEQALADARLEVWRRRRRGLLALAAAAVVVLLGVVLWRTGFVRWLWGLGAVAVVAAVADHMRAAAGWLKDVGPLFTAVTDVQKASHRLTEARLEAALEHKRQPSEVRKTEELGGTIRRLVEEPEYRDLLGLVTRTRERFKSLDDAVRLGRQDPAVAQPLQLERVVVMIDDLDRCAPEKVVTVLEAVHLLFDFELFVVLLAVDTRWLEQSLRIRYQQLLGGGAAASASDYLEKIIQVPLQVLPLDEQMVRRMLTGLAGASASTDPAPTGPASAEHAAGESSEHGDERDLREGKAPRQQRPLTQVLQITRADAVAMSAVAPLIGNTPRTVKRFVNTYRLLKARATDLVSFDQPRDGVPDHEIVAFLLAVVTGQPALTPLLTALADGTPGTTVRSALDALRTPDAAVPTEELSTWLTAHPAVANASAARCSTWAREVRRFTFTSQLP
jgi:hypothetical protein